MQFPLSIVDLILYYMGFLGIVVTVAVMVFGAGYFLLGSSPAHFSAENPVASQEAGDNEQEATNVEQGTAAGQIAQGMAMIDAAKEAKQLVEQKTADVMTQETTKSEPSSAKASDGQVGSKDQSALPITNRLISFGYGIPKSPRNIDTVVLHSSYNSTGGDEYSVDKVIGIWKGYAVAPHYMIDRKGTVYRLVEDKNIAYHAGVSKMPDGRTDVNDFSIGIEILNTEDDQYTSAQYDAVNDLVAYLKKDHGIKYVVGHSDIAPGRKTDPWNFDWKRLK